MALKQMSGVVTWKRFTTNSIETYLGKPGEPIVDMRTGEPAIRLCDGLTPMGHPIGVIPTLTGVARPIIISPVNNATDVDTSPVITASQFNGINGDGSIPTHAATIWNIATDAAFTQMTYNSGETALNKTTLDLSSVGVTLEQGSVYYIRVAYKSDSGVVSDWSATVKITTSTMGIGTVLPDGGIVFGQEGGDWLVVAPASQRTTKMWGLYGTDTSLPNWTSGSGTTTTPTDPNSSEYNTDVLTSPTYNSINDGQGSIGSPAAEYCRSLGYDLPNARDLQLIYNNRAQIDAADSSGGGATLSAIQSGTAPGSSTAYVWSSTENNSGYAWVLAFGNGNWYNSTKSDSYWVVPFRRIPV
jgi:hypothetical protein